ncbi:MAG TPA: amino acid permease, partial [Candidatus Udaeobacter sp.]|nr:amino acid permease [Candidatus Udaeobacter sp.]
FALLLFSAVNTSLVALINLQFLLARDREIPKVFQRLNKWGVPSLAMLMATVVPVLLVLLVKDISGLAELYAVGVVGAIATNLGATATDRTRPIRPWERAFMFVTFLLMAAIELSLLIDKPNARYFVITVLLIGLILRGLVQERRMKKEAAPALSPPQLGVDVARPTSEAPAPPGGEAILCAVRSAGRTLDFALREAPRAGSRLYLLFVREQPFMTEEDARRKWQQDPEASAIFAEAKQKAENITPLFCYAVSPSAAETIVDVAATLGASRVILGAPQRSALINLLRGNVIREVSNSLPEEIDLVVYA